MKYYVPQRVFLVKTYYQFQSITSVQVAFRREFATRESPSYKAIKNIISNFEKTDSVGRVSPKPKERSPKRENAKKQLESMFNIRLFSIIDKRVARS